jgi:large subunit ribosomal protein L28
MTGKKGSTGNRRSHSLRATRRTFGANIQKKRVFDPVTGKYVRMKVSTSYLRTLAKQLQKGH